MIIDATRTSSRPRLANGATDLLATEPAFAEIYGDPEREDGDGGRTAGVDGRGRHRPQHHRATSPGTTRRSSMRRTPTSSSGRQRSGGRLIPFVSVYFPRECGRARPRGDGRSAGVARRTTCATQLRELADVGRARHRRAAAGRQRLLPRRTATRPTCSRGRPRRSTCRCSSTPASPSAITTPASTGWPIESLYCVRAQRSPAPRSSPRTGAAACRSTR